MSDSTTERLQNMNIQQDFDGSEFDPFMPQNKMAGIQNGGQPVDLLGSLTENGQITNGDDQLVSFDHEAGFGLPDPTFLGQGQGQGQIPGFEGQQSDLYERNMSEGEILGYQNEYGESIQTGQAEYVCDSSEDDEENVEGTDIDQVTDPNQGQGQMLGDNEEGDYSHEQYSSQEPYDQYVENDYTGDMASGVDIVEEPYDEYENDQIDPNSWHPETDDPERLRRSRSPERSVSPYVKSESVDSTSEVSHSESLPGFSEASTIPVSQNLGYPDVQSQSSQPMSSETESLDSRSEAEGTPRKSKMRIPKPKTKKPKELPPWNDNVVIPPLPRMKPTLIGKKADLDPESPPPKFQRPKTAPARTTPKDASSDSGVEEESKLPRQNSADVKKKYGIDTNNQRYKPGGGNVQVFSQKIDTRSVAPRTDTSKPKSALMSPRISPSKEKAPSVPRTPTPNTKAVQSKIGSLNNVKHTPGGGNVKVLSTKIDVSNVTSKVGSKDKIDHKPKGGDKKIESRKLNWVTESKVGSLKNASHSPGGGNVKDMLVEVHATMNTRENVRYTPGGGNVPEPYEEDLEWEADAKVNTLDNLDYEPGGGLVKIFSEKLNWKAEPKVDTGLHRRSEQIILKPDTQRYDSSKQQLALSMEPIPNRSHTFLEPVPEVEYQSISDVKKDHFLNEPIRDSVTNDFMKDKAGDQLDGVLPSADQFGVGDTKIANRGPIPPPKPPTCIHQQWEIENLTENKFASEESDEKETLTFTREELDEILQQQEHVENDEKEALKPPELDEEDPHKAGIGISSVSKESRSDRRSPLSKTGVPIADITNTPVEEDILKNRAIDKKEETVVIEREVLRELDGKENMYLTPESEPAKVKKTSGFMNKMKDMFSSKKKKSWANKDSRFSSTSKSINRSNSDTSRISTKGKKMKEFASDEEKEVELMVKYLGYHSPKLTRKSLALPESDANRNTDKPKVKQPKIHKKITAEKSKPIEKMANLGYSSPKLARKGHGEIIMTGSPKQKKKSGIQDKGISNSTVKVSCDAKDRNDHQGGGHFTAIKLKGGINSDYQEIDFGTNVSDTKHGRQPDNHISILTDHEEALSQSLVEGMTEDHMTGFVNEGYVYDDVASDEETEVSDDSSTMSEEERHTSVAQIELKRSKKKGIQTTTYKFKMDSRPTSPLNEIRQEMIDYLEERFASAEDRVHVEGPNKSMLRRHQSEHILPVRDRFGYTLVCKEKRGVIRGNAGGFVITGIGKASSENDVSGLGRGRFKESALLKSPFDGTLSRKCHGESKSSQLGSEDDLTLEAELRTVLASMQDNNGSFLKSPRRHGGSETGSRPGTPKIPVKPLWMKAEEERRDLGMKRYLSDENLTRTHCELGRSKRTQSMMVGKPVMLNSMQKAGIGPVLAQTGGNVKRSSIVFNLSDQIEPNSNGVSTTRNVQKASWQGELQGIQNTEIRGSGEDEKVKVDKLLHETAVLEVPKFSDIRSTQNEIFQASDQLLKTDMSGNWNTTEIPEGEQLVVSQRLSWSAKSRVGSLDNAAHTPGGGNVKILDQKVEFKAKSKVGSTANIKHKPGGGDKKIETVKLEFKETAKPKVGSMEKVKHQPGGGDIKIIDEKPVWNAAAKVESLVNADHVPGGGQVKILDEKVDFSQTAKPKVGSMEKVKHQPGGGDKKIETQKLNFKETAKARTDTGASSGEKLSSRNHSRSGSVTSSQEGSAH